MPDNFKSLNVFLEFAVIPPDSNGRCTQGREETFEELLFGECRYGGGKIQRSLISQDLETK